ncbi:TIGR01841 family phasin [Paraburkholderia nemoris]|uniref:TIGR01841 family phasin n=1 Tax=Paraburkholderia nemoris TaxID=2793076 RepID=UPI0038BC1111
MSVFDAEQLIASQKINAVTLFGFTNQAFEGFQQLIELNIQTVRSALAKSETYWRDALSCKTPEEFLAWRTDLMRPAAEQALFCSRELADIGSSAYAEWLNAVSVQSGQYTSIAHTLVESAARNAPTGTEVVPALLRSAFSVVNDARDAARKAAENAIERAKGNFASTTVAAGKTGQQDAGQRSRAAKP